MYWLFFKMKSSWWSNKEVSTFAFKAVNVQSIDFMALAPLGALGVKTIGSTFLFVSSPEELNHSNPFFKIAGMLCRYSGVDINTKSESAMASLQLEIFWGKGFLSRSGWKLGISSNEALINWYSGHNISKAFRSKALVESFLVDPLIHSIFFKIVNAGWWVLR